MRNHSKLKTFFIKAFILLILRTSGEAFAEENGTTTGLIGHWKFDSDLEDSSESGLKAIGHGIDLGEKDHRGRENGAARFDGVDDYLEVKLEGETNLGRDEFTIAGWFETESVLDDVPGDLVSKFDLSTGSGFHLGIQHSPGVCTSQSNTRNLFFGIDTGEENPSWIDRGRPGENEMIYALTVFEGNLYAGTYEPGEGHAGSVYRYEGEDQWTYCGSPYDCNSVTALCVFEGKLYAAVSRYDAVGSHLATSSNMVDGGKVYRYEGGTEWTDCGRLGDAEYIFGLVEFEGDLYGTLIHSPNPSGDLTDLGLYRYEGGKEWAYCGNPGGRVCSLAPFNGSLYATGYDGGELGGVFRYEGGDRWTNCGVPGKTTQTYAFAFYEGGMHVATWPEGRVYRYESDGDWADVGRLGGEEEVMGMSVYNGKLYGGTLPLAQVYRYDGNQKWTLSGRLDFTPDIDYRRAWSMAVYDGQLFCGVLPSGHVHSLESGKVATLDRELAPGWKHIVAVKGSDRLRVYVDGSEVAQSTAFDPNDFDLTNEASLKIGAGSGAFFDGRISDLLLYNRALEPEEIDRLYQSE